MRYVVVIESDAGLKKVEKGLRAILEQGWSVNDAGEDYGGEIPHNLELVVVLSVAEED